MEDPRIRKFAQFLIRSAVGLEKGEKILIELHGSETGLMKALVQEAYAVGGKPFVHIFDYAVEGALVQGADAEHMEEIASYELERMRDMDAYIDIRATTNISMWHNVSDEAQKRYRQYYWGPIHLAERCNHTKWSVLRYPNDAMAQLAGVSTEEYEDFYFRACLVDYDKMGRAMQPLQDLMARTDKVRIVAPGTDISFSIKGIPSFGMHGNRNIPDGEIYGIIGMSGAGKSTLLKLLLGWLPDYTGTISFDDVDIHTVTPAQLQQQMSYIEQNVFLFNTTIRENITLGEDFSEEQLHAAIQGSALAADLAAMPDGLDTVVGENGSNLSGGQKQRVAIARALIHNRSILLVDEGTSALDQKNADLVEKSLLTNPDLTLILISHHLSAERRTQFDRVYELTPVTQ